MKHSLKRHHRPIRHKKSLTLARSEISQPCKIASLVNKQSGHRSDKYRAVYHPTLRRRIFPVLTDPGGISLSQGPDHPHLIHLGHILQGGGWMMVRRSLREPETSAMHLGFMAVWCSLVASGDALECSGAFSVSCLFRVICANVCFDGMCIMFCDWRVGALFFVRSGVVEMEGDLCEFVKSDGFNCVFLFLLLKVIYWSLMNLCYQEIHRTNVHSWKLSPPR